MKGVETVQRRENYILTELGHSFQAGLISISTGRQLKQNLGVAVSLIRIIALKTHKVADTS